MTCQINVAILNNKLIEFSYGNRSKRTIEPMEIVYKGQTWYLYGFCKFIR
ncbi:MAG: WYL domain-containing protein [Paraclostridium bifermentans]|nr:WYL domain-containing protein [Paraclostridium bifermentans]MBS6508467.1 WYL domain-containing protein [Paraclostridium bifermentans]